MTDPTTFRAPVTDAVHITRSSTGHTFCPSCGSNEVEGAGGPDFSASGASNPMYCLSCGAHWEDCYSLVGYDALHDAQGREVPHDSGPAEAQALTGQLQPERPEPVNAALLAALSRIAAMEPGSRGAYSKFAECSSIAKSAIAAAEKAPQPQPIVVKVRSGLVDEVVNIPRGMTVEVRDYDVEGEPYEDGDDPSDRFDADEEGKLHGCVEFTAKEG